MSVLACKRCGTRQGRLTACDLCGDLVCVLCLIWHEKGICNA